MRSDESLAGSHHRGETALHVRCAATVQESVAHDGLERIGLPLFAWTGRHDVCMTSETQHRPCVAMSRPEILDRAERHALDAKADGFQALPDDLQTAMILGADRR